MFFWIVVAVLILQHPNLSRLELFNSISYFESFLEHENETLATLEHHVRMEQERIDNLKKNILEYKSAINYGKTFGVDNPVQFYLIMKEIMQKWHSLNETITSNRPEDIMKSVSDKRQAKSVSIPMEDDLDTVRVAIQRLQQVYNLKQEDIVYGKVLGNIQSSLKLDANDCFKMGLLYYADYDYNGAYLWMKQALLQLKLEQDNPTVDKFDILKYLAHVSFKKRLNNQSDDILSEMISMVKDDETFYNHLQSYSRSATNINDTSFIEELIDLNNSDYISLCSGANISDSDIKSILFCYYKMDRPFLRLAPFKVELLNLNPHVYFFHQVISDATIDTVIGLAKDKLKQALVIRNGTGIKSQHRTAKNAWLSDEDHEIISQITNRISDMTNLDAYYAEPLQIANYDIGGHYSFHYDAIGAYENEKLRHKGDMNDRIATVLFYLSTPYAGGATGFPKVWLSINATKNDAVFWYNLMKNGDADMQVLHGGCPVLSGQKWIANKWIRQNGQELLRQCSLNPDE